MTTTPVIVGVACFFLLSAGATLLVWVSLVAAKRNDRIRKRHYTKVDG